MDKVVDAWNTSHPTIHVTFSKQAGGDSEAEKVLTAAKAHAMPDVIQAEYQEIPTMVSNNVLADISGQANAVKGKFPAAVWNQVTLGGSGAVYGVPQDTAPMLFFYRKSLFAKYGLAVPKTWDDYASSPREVKQKAPNSYLADFPSRRPRRVRRPGPAGRREMVDGVRTTSWSWASTTPPPRRSPTSGTA